MTRTSDVMSRSSIADSPQLPPVFRWTPAGRALVFFLSAMSIWCLLAEFYGLCSMRSFTLYALIPATVARFSLMLSAHWKA